MTTSSPRTRAPPPSSPSTSTSSTRSPRPQAFTSLRARGLRVRRPERTVATADHSTPTAPRGLPIIDPMAAAQVKQLEANCAEFGIPIHAYGTTPRGSSTSSVPSWA